MSKKQGRRFLSRTTIPLQYWWNIQDTGNHIYLVKDSDHIDVDTSQELIDLYKSIADEILSIYGVSDNYLKYLKDLMRYVIMKNEALSKGDEHKSWKADVLKMNIDKKLEKETGAKREDSLIIIGKFVYGSPISPMNITLDQFHQHLDYANREIASQSKQKLSMING